MKTFNIIAAVDEDLGIGKGGALPWHLLGDLRHFKELTVTTQSPEKKNAVIMGRKTWDSLPDGVRPLPGRINVVVSRNASLALPTDVIRVPSLDAALAALQEPARSAAVEQIFVIGGAQMYADALRHPQCARLYITHVLSRFGCDVFFPEFKSQFKLAKAEPHKRAQAFEYYFAEYSKGT